MDIANSRYRSTLWRSLWILVAGLVPSGGLPGQGLLVNVEPDHHIRLPRPYPLPPPLPASPESYAITAIDASVTIHDQVARATISQTFKNTGPRQMEVCFWFPLPYDSAVDQLTLMVNGREIPGKLMKGSEARSIYESIVRKNQDPALLEWMGSGLFKTSVFPVPAGESRTVTLHYTQAYRATRGVTDFLLPLTTAKYTDRPIESFQLRVDVTTSTDLKSIYAPHHEVMVERDGNRRAKVLYQRKQWVPDSDFRLMLDTGDGPIRGRLVSYRAQDDPDGYFAFFATPEFPRHDAPAVAKTVLLVVDRSGSMSGEKMEQAREALRFVVDHLRDGDLFNVIAYDTEVELFRNELQRCDDATRQQAHGFIRSLHAGGSTNIDGALQAALKQLQDKQQPNYVIFLSDGMPTVGESSVGAISKNVLSANHVKARLFCFGVGYDVNSRLLDRLSRDNSGTTVFIRPNEKIEGAVSQLYQQVESPVLTNARLWVESPDRTAADGVAVDRMYPQSPFDLFAGQQLLVVGRSRVTGSAKMIVEGRLHGKVQRYEFPVEFSREYVGSADSFVARLWAVRRVGELLDLLDLQGQNDELVQELVALATRHGIVTPYTSFLADESDKPIGLAERESLARDALQRNLGEDSGVGAFENRAQKSSLRRADTLDAEVLNNVASVSDGSISPSRVAGRPSVGRDRGRNVQHVAGRTLYRRGDRWVDSVLEESDERIGRTVVRYSDEFFQVLAQLGPDASQLAALEGEIVVRLHQEVYRIVDP